MDQRSIDALGELQRAVLESLWESGEATVTEARERLAPERRLAYTTVLSVLQKLEKAGWVRHRQQGRAYVYQSTRSRNEEGRSTLRAFTRRVFGGDRLVLFQHLLDQQDLSDEDVAELRRMIENYRKERSDD